MNLKFDSNSSRRRQAKLARRMTKLEKPGWLLGIILATAGVLLAAQGQQLGITLFGLDGFLVMVLIWAKWQLRQLKPDSRILAGEVWLDRILESNLLAKWVWPADSKQVWEAAVRTWEGAFILNRLGLPWDLFSNLLDQTDASGDIEATLVLKDRLSLEEVDGGMIVAAMLLHAPSFKRALTELKLDDSDVLEVLQWQQRVKQILANLKRKPYFGGLGRDWASGYTPTLSQYARDLTSEVEAGYSRRLPQVHEAAIAQVINQLRGNRPSVALIGDVGSGKTSLVYSLAERLISAKDASGLEYYKIMSLNASLILSSSSRIEATVLQLLAEGIHARNIIIFLDEAQLFFGRGPGAVDLSKILLPILQQGSLKLILAMSPHDWQELTAANTALAGSLQRVILSPASQSDTMSILEDAAIGIEHKAGKFISFQALKEAYRLSERYLPEIAFPGKAITVIESATNYAEGKLVTAASVQQSLESTIGVKVTAAGQAEKDQLLNLESQIHNRMINQVRAVKVVADALRRNRAGVGNPNRPVGSFLFLGPTGVGKTELAKSLAAVYYEGEDRIIRLDMTEYQQATDVGRLLAPAAERTSGSNLLSAIRRQPFSVVLLDEVEKSHPDILNLLLQLLDEGRLTDTDGRVVSFKDAIIISTSNAGADKIRSKIESGQKLEAFEEEIISDLIESHQFRPELLNRLDEIVVFRPLAKNELLSVIDLMIAAVNQTLSRQKVSIELTPAAKARLVEQGYDPRLGARPMRRMIQRAVENTVAQKILAGTTKSGDHLQLDVGDLQSE